MLFPKLLIAAVILFAGLSPMVFLSPLTGMIGAHFHLDAGPVMVPMVHTLTMVSRVGMILLLVVAAILILRHLASKHNKVEYGPTWGCGYTAATPRQQYTATSFSGNIAELGGPVLGVDREFGMIHEEDIFPAKRTFTLRTADFFRTATGRATDLAMTGLKRIARLQTGNIQHYILYAFVFILVIFVLLYMNAI
jgi:hypothetical protein